MASVLSGQRARLILAGVFLAGAVALLLVQSRGRAELTDRINFVCVATGKTYRLERAEVEKLPALNPDTGQRTLLPFGEKNGRRYISRRKARFLRQLADVNKYVDPKTLEVLSSPR